MPAGRLVFVTPIVIGELERVEEGLIESKPLGNCSKTFTGIGGSPLGARLISTCCAGGNGSPCRAVNVNVLMLVVRLPWTYKVTLTNCAAIPPSTLTVPEYVPNGKVATTTGFKERLIREGVLVAMPLSGLAVSQLPPEVVNVDAANDSAPPIELILIDCDPRTGPPLA